MAIYGIGAMYGGTDDMMDSFIQQGVACVGFLPGDAPAIHAQMAKIKVGDVVFIKSYVPTTGLHIKAVGIVTDATLRKINASLGYGVDVRWRRCDRIDVGKVDDHSDYMRRGSLYEEFNPSVQATVLDALLPPSDGKE